MPDQKVTQTRSLREQPRKRHARAVAMRELVRQYETIEGLLKKYHPSPRRCDVCGKRCNDEKMRKHFRKIYGKDGKRLYREWQRQNQLRTESYVAGRKLVFAVCSKACLDEALNQKRESERCLQLLSEGRLQISSLRKFLTTGRLDAFDSLPEELQPQASSKASCQPSCLTSSKGESTPTSATPQSMLAASS